MRFINQSKRAGRPALDDVHFQWSTSATRNVPQRCPSIPTSDGMRMSELTVMGASCPQCASTLAQSANFCSHCGVPTAPPFAPSGWLTSDSDRSVARTCSQPASGSPWNRALNHRGIVITILLCVGPVGLPALWFSRRFSNRSKILLTASYFLVTILLPLLVTWYWVEVSLRPLLDCFGS